MALSIVHSKEEDNLETFKKSTAFHYAQPDFTVLIDIKRLLNNIYPESPKNFLEILRTYQTNSAVMAVPSMRRLFWVIDKGMRINTPIHLHYGRLVYTAQEKANKIFIFFGDIKYGPYQFAQITEDFKIQIWREKEMFLMFPDTENGYLIELNPDNML